MPKPRKEPVEKVREPETCGSTFKTRYPHRAHYCSSRCRSEVWNKGHRVEDKGAFAREGLRAHWSAEWKRNGPA